MVFRVVPWLIFDTFVFGISSLFFGYIVDDLIAQYNENESIYTTVWLLLLQTFVNIVLIYLIDYVYETLVGRDSDETFGITILTVLLFIPQAQIYDRAEVIYTYFTGYKHFDHRN